MNSLQVLKNEFSKAFVEVISTKSIEDCKKLVLSYEEQNILFRKNGFDMKEEAYNEVLTKQCQEFFKKWGSFIDEKNADFNTKLIYNNIDQVDTYTFEINNVAFQFLDTITISMKSYKKEDKMYQVGFQIDDPLFINGRFALNNMLLTRCYESYWDNLESIPYKNKIDSLDTFKNLVKQIDDNEIVEELFEIYDESSDWYLYDGNLELDNFDEKVNLLITGNLTIKEELAEITTELIVMGKTTVNALYLDDYNNVFLLGGVEFNVALLSCDSGAVRIINHPSGPFLYNDSISTTINHSKKVKCYVDHANDKFNGSILAMLKAKYINGYEPSAYEEVEENDYRIDEDKIVEDLRLGENIFNNSRDIAHFVKVKKDDLD